jgi:hypothetical protein
VQQDKVSHKNQKHIEINVFLLQREKRRVLFLYNETLKRRRELFKYMRAQVKHTVRERSLEVGIMLHGFINSLYKLHKMYVK